MNFYIYTKNKNQQNLEVDSSNNIPR